MDEPVKDLKIYYGASFFPSKNFHWFDDKWKGLPLFGIIKLSEIRAGCSPSLKIPSNIAF